MSSQELSSLILVGWSGSGKSTLGRALSAWSGLQLLEVGDTVRQAAALAETTPLELADLTFALGQPLEFLNVALGARRHHNVILVGLRRPEELVEARRVLPGALTIALATPLLTRRSRQERREHPFSLRPTHGTGAKLDERDRIETKWGMDVTISMADATIDSSLPIKALRKTAIGLWVAHPTTRVA